MIIIVLLFAIAYFLYSIYSNQQQEKQRITEIANLYNKCLQTASDTAYISRMQIDIHNDGVVSPQQDQAIRDQFDSDVGYCNAKYGYK